MADEDDIQRQMDAEYQHYLRETENYEAHYLEISKRYHQWVLTLSGGALALSITFVEKIAGSSPQHTWVLASGWSLLILSLVAQLWSLYRSQGLIEQRREEARDQYRKRIEAITDDQGSEDGPEGEQYSPLERLVQTLNKTSIAALTMGLLAVSTFSFLNIPMS